MKICTAAGGVFYADNLYDYPPPQPLRHSFCSVPDSELPDDGAQVISDGVFAYVHEVRHFFHAKAVGEVLQDFGFPPAEPVRRPVCEKFLKVAGKLFELGMDGLAAACVLIGKNTADDMVGLADRDDGDG